MVGKQRGGGGGKGEARGSRVVCGRQESKGAGETRGKGVGGSGGKRERRRQEVGRKEAKRGGGDKACC